MSPFSVALRASLPVDMSGVDGGAAKWRRERRLRAMLRHERQTVAMELAAALHHSRDAGRESTEDSQLRGAARCPDGAGAAGPGATMVFSSALTGRS